MNIFLTGSRGSGKSTIGRLLAQNLSLDFREVDEWIVRRAGQTIARIFKEQGEPAFRDLEARVVGEITKLSDQVVDLGGGTLMRNDNFTAIKTAASHVIYLRCDADELFRRISGDPATSENRPNLTLLGGGIDEIKELIARREPIYRRAMTAEINVTNISPQQAVDQIMRLL